MATVLRFSDHRRKLRRVFFSRAELQQLLTLYSRQVMRGEWRDYAIDQRDGAALFSVFRRTHESPIFTFVKTAPRPNRDPIRRRTSLRTKPLTGARLPRLVRFAPSQRFA
jgi:hypothetical protein